MHNWLQNYVYRINIGVALVVLAALITLIITLLTVSYKAWQASIMNPATAIKTE